jgi:hypothetical protein
LVNEIRIYVEGGGHSKESAALREGLSNFLKDLIGYILNNLPISGNSLPILTMSIVI